MSQNSTGNGTLPEYVTADEIEALLDAAPHEPARLVMMVMWRAGLRVSEAADLQIGDCRLKDRNPVLRVRRGKGRRSRLVPVHDELAQALQVAIDFAPARAGARRSAKTRLFDVTRRTVGRWIEIAVGRAVEAGALDADRQISPHTFRHSFARHVLANGVPINVLSRWLGHRSIATTFAYLELHPDLKGWMKDVE